MTKRGSAPDARQSSRILDVLETKHFSGNAYAMLREVRNATGWAGNRAADAVVTSCWPSRGVWFAGIEVKVSRSDWLRELRDPEKSCEVQRFCSYWWIAAPAGIVVQSELPKTWGLIEVGDKSCKVVVDAPTLTPEPPSALFVASILRNHAKEASATRNADYRRGYDEATEQYGDATGIEALKTQLASEIMKRERAENSLERLQQQCANFAQLTGVTIDAWNGNSMAMAFRAAQEFRAAKLPAVEKTLRAAADAVASAISEGTPREV